MTKPTLLVADPRTYKLNPEREGLPGHPGFGRVSDFFLRLPPSMKLDLVARATLEKKTITDLALEFLAVGLYGPQPDATFLEPPEPELTPEVAHENLETILQKAFVIGELIAPASPNKQETDLQQEPPERPNLWTDLIPALTQRVTEQSFDVWLSAVRFLHTDHNLLQLQVPNTYFQDYLTEHYTEVIQEELQMAHSTHFKVEFVVAPPKAEATLPSGQSSSPANPLLDLMATHNISTLDQLESFEDSLYPQLYRHRLDAAAQRCTRYQGDVLSGRRVVGFNDARMAEEVAILKNQRLKEEKTREEFRKKRRALFAMCHTIKQLRKKGNPRNQRQYAATSHFDPEGPVTRGEVSALSQALKAKDYS
jgi:hypothetical protein